MRFPFDDPSFWDKMADAQWRGQPSRPLLYVLDLEDNPMPVESMRVWTDWMVDNVDRCVVACTVIDLHVQVRTVFLGFDPIRRSSSPLLYETMIDGGKTGGLRVLYAARDFAERGHARVVRRFVGLTALHNRWAKLEYTQLPPDIEEGGIRAKSINTLWSTIYTERSTITRETIPTKSTRAPIESLN